MPRERQSDNRAPREKKDFEERVVAIDRVSRTVKGGKRMRFRALVVVGNRKGRVGMGIGKAGDVQGAIKKAVTAAKKKMIVVPIVNETIPHDTTSKFGGATIFLKPAPAGTSIIAGGPVRAVIELSGIRNILSKIIGSTNKINNVAATMQALTSLHIGADQSLTEFTDEPEETPVDEQEVVAVAEKGTK